MKTMKEWRQKLSMKNISSFFEIVLGVALFSLVFLCVNASKYWAEGYVLVTLFSLAVAAVIMWRIRVENKKERQGASLCKQNSNGQRDRTS